MKKSKLPFISLITLSWNKKEDIIELVKTLLNQKYEMKEIIVVDNASTDGTVEFLRENYPSLRIIPLKKNYGLHDGFNFGVVNAKGTIIIGIDQDCVLEDKEVVNKVVRCFNEGPALGIVAFRVKNAFTGEDSWDNPTHLKEGKIGQGYPCLAFNGCGFAVLREAYTRAGGLDGQFFIYHGELDLTLRVLDQGYGCRYFPDIVVFHKSLKVPTSNCYLKITARNYTWLIWKNFPLKEILRARFLPFYSLLSRNPTLFFSTFSEVMSGFGQVLKKRKPLSAKTINYYRFLVMNKTR